MTVDHIIPKAQNGSNSIKNLQPMCSPCNGAKADSAPRRKRRFPGKVKVTLPPEQCKIKKREVDWSTV
jgi:5-methylcytosine-specific restriction endonuclease McrA